MVVGLPSAAGSNGPAADDDGGGVGGASSQPEGEAASSALLSDLDLSADLDDLDDLLDRDLHLEEQSARVRAAFESEVREQLQVWSRRDLPSTFLWLRSPTRARLSLETDRHRVLEELVLLDDRVRAVCVGIELPSSLPSSPRAAAPVRTHQHLSVRAVRATPRRGASYRGAGYRGAGYRGAGYRGA